MGSRGAKTIRAGTALLVLWLAGGCATQQAYRARFHAPNYLVTPAYFERAPQRVAIFPFAARALKEETLARAQICRLAFYQHFSVRDFEDVELEALDRKLLPEEEAQARRRLNQFAMSVRRLDVMGLTSVFDLDPLLDQKTRDTLTFRDWTRTASDRLQADAYVLGITRGYGRFYAVLFSSIGLATRLELRALKDDALLWSVEHKARNVALPLTLDPLSLPMRLYDIWRNSYGEALDLLAYRVYRDVIRTLPSGRTSGPVYVRADRDKTRIFRNPTLWAFWPQPTVKKGTRMKFLLERRGWVQCLGPKKKAVWILRRHGTLVDADGTPLQQGDPLAALWDSGS